MNKSMKGVRLELNRDRHHFTADGKPWLYVADTAWTLFKRLDHDDVERYLTDRVEKGFNVIQAYVLRGLEVKNFRGDLPLMDRDPTRFNEGFFGNIDRIVSRANDLGLVMSMVATQGEHVKRQVNTTHYTDRNEQVFTIDNAFVFGRNLGRRYKQNAVIWMLGGDRSPSPDDISTWDAMARGMKDGSDGLHLVSYHSSGGHSSSEFFHDFDWLDFNTVQSKHASGDPNYKYIAKDYALTPVKPTLDMESRYETIPESGSWDAPKDRIDAFSARQAVYWGLFAGAAGHGYGHNSIWQMHDPNKPDSKLDYSFPVIVPTVPWYEALNSPGANDIGYLAKLLAARPWYETSPAPQLIVSQQGVGEDVTLALRANDGSFALVFMSYGSPIELNLASLKGPLQRRWFDPRAGKMTEPVPVEGSGRQRFEAPSSGRGNDWVLVLENRKRTFEA